jgi:hypothetical protein
MVTAATYPLVIGPTLVVGAIAVIRSGHQPGRKSLQIRRGLVAKPV